MRMFSYITKQTVVRNTLRRKHAAKKSLISVVLLSLWPGIRRWNTHMNTLVIHVSNQGQCITWQVLPLMATTTPTHV